MTQRRTVAAAIWAIAAALGAFQASLPAEETAEEATSRRSDSVRIGMVDSLFREVPKPMLTFIMQPFATLMQQQTGLTGQIVLSRAESATQDQNVCPRKPGADYAHQVFKAVPNNGFESDFNAQIVELLGQIKRVCVLSKGSEKLRSYSDDFRNHSGSLNEFCVGADASSAPPVAEREGAVWRCDMHGNMG